MSSATSSDASGGDDTIALVVVFYQHYRLTGYTAVSVFALLLFEYLITFDREVGYFWGQKRTWAKAMFFLNRYISLLQSFVTVLSILLPPSSFSCVFLARIIEACQISLYAVWAVFSALRVYALSHNQRAVAVLVAALSSIPVATFTALSATADLEVDVLPIEPYPNYCYNGYNTTTQVYQALGVVTHVALMLAEIIVIVVTFSSTWDLAPRRDQSPKVLLARLVLKEGILYFLAMILINSSQVISDFVQNPQFAAACVFFNLLVPILVSRFYFNLDDIRRAEDRRKAKERCGAELERARSMFKPLPPLPEYEVSDTRVHYVDEVFRYNGRVLGRTAVYA